MNFSRLSSAARQTALRLKELALSLRIPTPQAALAKIPLPPLGPWARQAGSALKSKAAFLKFPRVSPSIGKPDFSRLRSRTLKEAALMRERIISLKDVTASFEDPKLMWVSGILFIVFQATITWMLMRVDSPWEILRHQIQTNVDEYLVIRDNWGPEKTRLYLQHYWLDFIHPAVYAVFFRCLLTQLQLSYPTKYVYHALSFPIGAAIYDEIENICQLALMAGWTESKFVFFAGAFGTYAKWLLLLATFGAVVYAFGKMWWEKQLE